MYNTKKNYSMSLETRKIYLAQRLLNIRKESILKRYEKLLMQAEMEERAELSLQAIDQEKVISLEEFSKNAKEWIKKKRSTK